MSNSGITADGLNPFSIRSAFKPDVVQARAEASVLIPSRSGLLSNTALHSIFPSDFRLNPFSIRSAFKPKEYKA